MSSKVGFIGLGIMGKGMMQNLATKLPNSEFVIWNRSTEVCGEFVTKFPGKVVVAESPASVIQQCGVTYSMLSTIEASESVFDKPDDGAIAGVSEGKTIVDCATLSPERMIFISEAVTAKGGRYLEAPVSGSKVPAETGTLIFLCGGDEEVFSDPDVKAGLDACGKASYFLGPIGSGTRMKLVVNSLMGTMLNAFTEGMALCKEAQLPQDILLSILDLGAMANPMFKMKGNNIIANKYDAHFPLKHAQKDINLALNLANNLGVSMPVTEKSNEQYKKVLEQYGDEDFSAIMKVDSKK
jgi:3-hydroxyisobutyrate dehydrogenase-like beta-hydroxyacid dehydrogenase